MKKSDLYREWARVLDMCEGTTVRPTCAWKYKGFIQNDKSPNFEYDAPGAFEFLVSIVEDKPVFVGDKLYFPNGTPCIIENNELLETMSVLSWEPPKKTFILNGKKLPCPQRDFDSKIPFLEINGGSQHLHKFVFKSYEDRNSVADAIIRLLIDNTI